METGKSDETTGAGWNLPDGWEIDRLSTMPDGVTQSVRLVCKIAGSTVGAITSYDEDADLALAKACNEARRVAGLSVEAP